MDTSTAIYMNYFIDNIVKTKHGWNKASLKNRSSLCGTSTKNNSHCRVQWPERSYSLLTSAALIAAQMGETSILVMTFVPTVFSL
jgi:hypothetical protein